MKRRQKLFIAVVFCCNLIAVPEVLAMNNQPELLKQLDLPSLFVRYEIANSEYQRALSIPSLVLNSFLSYAIPGALQLAAIRSGNSASIIDFQKTLKVGALFAGLNALSQQGIHLGKDKLLCLFWPSLRKKRNELQEIEKVIHDKIEDKKSLNLLPYLNGLQGASLDLWIKLFKNNGQHAQELPSNAFFETSADIIPDDAWKLLRDLTDPNRLVDRKKALGSVFHGDSGLDKKALCKFIAHAAEMPMEYVTATELPIKMHNLTQGQDILQEMRLKAAALGAADAQSKQLIIEQRRWVAAIAELHVQYNVMAQVGESGNKEAANAQAEIHKLKDLFDMIERGNKLLCRKREVYNQLRDERVVLKHYTGNKVRQWYRWAHGFFSDREDEFTGTQKSVIVLEHELDELQQSFDSICEIVCARAKIAGIDKFEQEYQKSNVGIMVVENMNDLCQKDFHGKITQDPAAVLLLDAMNNPENKNVMVVETAASMNGLSVRLKDEKQFPYMVEVKSLSEDQRIVYSAACLSKNNAEKKVKDALPQIAQKTEKFSQQDLRKMFVIARQNALNKATIRNDKKHIRLEDVNEAIVQQKIETILRHGNDRSNVTFEDVIGSDPEWVNEDPHYAGQLPSKIMSAMIEMIDIKCAEKQSAEQPNMIIFGPPGTGKSLLATKEIPYLTGCPVWKFSGSMFTNSYYSGGKEIVDEMFKKIDYQCAKLSNLSPSKLRSIREQRRKILCNGVVDDTHMNVPLVVVIDEGDVLGRQRRIGLHSSVGDDEHNKAITAFMSQMQGVGKKRNVIFIITTNFAESEEAGKMILDKAFLDRFRHKVDFLLPSAEDRVEIAKTCMSLDNETRWTPKAYQKVCQFVSSQFPVNMPGRLISSLVSSIIAKKRQEISSPRVRSSHVDNVLMSFLRQEWRAMLPADMKDVMRTLKIKEKNLSKEEIEFIKQAKPQSGTTTSWCTNSSAPIKKEQPLDQPSMFMQMMQRTQDIAESVQKQNETLAGVVRGIMGLPSATTVQKNENDRQAWLQYRYGMENVENSDESEF